MPLSEPSRAISVILEFVTGKVRGIRSSGECLFWEASSMKDTSFRILSYTYVENYTQKSNSQLY